MAADACFITEDEEGGYLEYSLLLVALLLNRWVSYCELIVCLTLPSPKERVQKKLV